MFASGPDGEYRNIGAPTAEQQQQQEEPRRPEAMLWLSEADHAYFAELSSASLGVGAGLRIPSDMPAAPNAAAFDDHAAADQSVGRPSRAARLSTSPGSLLGLSSSGRTSPDGSWVHVASHASSGADMDVTPAEPCAVRGAVAGTSPYGAVLQATPRDFPTDAMPAPGSSQVPALLASPSLAGAPKQRRATVYTFEQPRPLHPRDYTADDSERLAKRPRLGGHRIPAAAAELMRTPTPVPGAMAVGLLRVSTSAEVSPSDPLVARAIRSTQTPDSPPKVSGGGGPSPLPGARPHMGTAYGDLPVQASTVPLNLRAQPQAQARSPVRAASGGTAVGAFESPTSEVTHATTPSRAGADLLVAVVARLRAPPSGPPPVPAQVPGRGRRGGGPGAVSKSKVIMECEVCHRSVVSARGLARHMRIHTGDKPYDCGVCGRSFRQKGTLKSHERIHLGLRPFKCPDCGRHFRHNASMKRHLRTHGKEASSSRPRSGGAAGAHVQVNDEDEGDDDDDEEEEESADSSDRGTPRKDTADADESVDDDDDDDDEEDEEDGEGESASE